MSDTKEAILQTALRLFARDGYEAVSVSAIAGELGITKGALYRHYESKRAIFACIVGRMERSDAERAQAHAVPEGTLSQQCEQYESTSLASICKFSAAQFHYWTEEEFSANFRRLLTLEQYRSAEMARLYQQYLASGPLEYLADLFGSKTGDAEKGRELALKFYGPMFLLYSVYDAAGDKKAVTQAFGRHLARFAKEMEEAV